MVSSNLPSPSGPSPAPSPPSTLDAILAPHHALNPPANITHIPTDAERRAACITSSRNAPSEPARFTFAPFRPDAHTLEGVLSDLVSSNHSLDTIAAKHNTSIPALTLWMNRPDVQPLLEQMESACYRHARLAAAHALPEAVKALTLILNCASEAEASIPIPREDSGILVRERSRTNTRKAAWLLYRISRSHPSIPMDAATRVKLEELRTERAKLKARLNARLKAQSSAQHRAHLSPSRGTTFDDAALGGTTGEGQSGVSSESDALGGTAGVLQSGVSDQAPPAPSEPIEDMAQEELTPSPAPDPSLASPSPSPSLRHSVTASLSSALILCGMTSDTS